MNFEEYVKGLQEVFPSPPSYDKFVEMWDTWDASSRKFITRYVSPDDANPHLRVIAKYIKRMRQEARESEGKPQNEAGQTNRRKLGRGNL